MFIEMREQVATAHSTAGVLSPWQTRLPGRAAQWSLQKAEKATFDHAAFGAEKVRRASAEDNFDRLGPLLHATDPENGQALGNAPVCEEVITLGFGSSETSAIARAWACSLPPRHP